MHLSEQEVVRRQEREELQKLGINPYPSETFDVNVTARGILQNYEKRKTDYKNISIAGRLMSRRIMALRLSPNYRMKQRVFRSI